MPENMKADSAALIEALRRQEAAELNEKLDSANEWRDAGRGLLTILGGATAATAPLIAGQEIKDLQHKAPRVAGRPLRFGGGLTQLMSVPAGLLATALLDRMQRGHDGEIGDEPEIGQ